MKTFMNLSKLTAPLIIALSLTGCAAMNKRAVGSGGAPPTAAPAAAQGPQAAWNATDSISAPESAYYHSPSGTIFVSNVVGQPNLKDAQGWISRFDVNGKLTEAKWVTGLNAPKGLVASGGTLWVSDIDELVGIEIATGKILHRIVCKGAKFLNDTAAAADGTIYVSDMLGDAIYMVKDTAKGAKIFVKGAGYDAPNGLLAVGDLLYVAAWGKGVKSDFSTKLPGNLYAINLQTKQVTFITKTPLGNLDGLIQDETGNFFVSDWMAGKVFYVTSDGRATLLMEGFKGSADLGYVPGERLLLIPRMGENVVSAYRL